MVADSIQRCDTRKHNVRLISLVSTRAQYEIPDDKDDVKVRKRIVSAIGELKRSQKKGAIAFILKIIVCIRLQIQNLILHRKKNSE